ncbi:MAG TPA: hypothetical protein VFU47_06095 [Armatimonadota bacterium]|nr:hypothetical protein [Armatimonadota bacterium]
MAAASGVECEFCFAPGRHVARRADGSTLHVCDACVTAAIASQRERQGKPLTPDQVEALGLGVRVNAPMDFGCIEPASRGEKTG